MSARTRKFGAILLALPIPLAIVGLFGAQSLGCFDRSCEDSFEERVAGTGHLLDRDTWESNPIDGDWVDYGPRRTIFFHWPELGGRKPQVLLPYISSVQNPLAPGSVDTFTLAGGDLATFTNVTGEGVFVRNNTCAHYYIRLVASASRASDASVQDANVQDANMQDASVEDAATDASDAGIGDAASD